MKLTLQQFNNYYKLLDFFQSLNQTSRLYEYTQLLLDFRYEEKLIEMGMPDNQECNNLDCWVIINDYKFYYSQTIEDVVLYLIRFKV